MDADKEKLLGVSHEELIKLCEEWRKIEEISFWGSQSDEVSIGSQFIAIYGDELSEKTRDEIYKIVDEKYNLLWSQRHEEKERLRNEFAERLGIEKGYLSEKDHCDYDKSSKLHELQNMYGHEKKKQKQQFNADFKELETKYQGEELKIYRRSLQLEYDTAMKKLEDKYQNDIAKIEYSWRTVRNNLIEKYHAEKFELFLDYFYEWTNNEADASPYELGRISVDSNMR